MNAKELAALQIQVNKHFTFEGLEKLAREVVKMTSAQYSEFLGYLPPFYNQMINQKEAKAILEIIDSKEYKEDAALREKIIREFI